MVIDVNLPPENPQQNFEEFFREYEDEPNHFKYRELIQQAAQTHEHVLYIYFEDLLSFDPALADFLKNEPEVALRHATESFKEVLRHYSGGQIDDGDYFVRLSTKNNSLMVKLRELRSSHIDKAVHVWGILIRASQIIPQITVATFICPICQTQMEVEQIEVNNLILPARCANPSCNNKKGFTVVERDSQFIDWQSIKIQELQEELKPGRVPYGIKGILTHDLVDKARPGDRVKITGIYKIYPNENNKGKPTTLFTPYIKVLSIEGRNREEENLEISNEEMEEIKRWSKKKDIQKIIAKSLAPGIMGNDHLKMAACMSLFGGVKKEYENQASLRGDIHVLFVGDPGTGKSIHRSEQIYIGNPKLSENKWSIHEIGNFIDKLMEDNKNSIIKLNETEIFRIEDDNPFYTLSINPAELKIIESKILEISRHKNDKILKIFTQSGREILATENHSFTTMIDGTLKVIEGKDLKIGTFLPIARNINISDSDYATSFNFDEYIEQSEIVDSSVIRECFEEEAIGKVTKTEAIRKSNIIHTAYDDYQRFQDKLPRNGWIRTKDDTSWFPRKISAIDSFGRIIGFYLAEGNIENRGVKISNTNSTIKKILCDDFKEIFERVTPFEKGVIFSQASISRWFKNKFGSGAVEKKIPPEVIMAPKSFKKNLISAYFSGDGWIEEKSASVNALTKSEKLAYSLLDILSTLGIFASIKQKVLKSGKYQGNKYYNIKISGEEVIKFYEQIGFLESDKQKRLEFLTRKILHRKRYQSLDIIPNFGRLILDIVNKLGLKSNRNSEYRNFIAELRGKTQRQYAGRVYLNKIIQELKLITETKENYNIPELEWLNKIVNSDLYWDKIIKIEIINDNDYVYDLGTIDGHFLVARGNIVVHNSQILKQCSLVAPQSVFTSGRGSSAAGLTAGIVKESESGGMSLEAGALVLADGGVALIDEFDKMNKSDRVAIHEAMEQQSISIAKAGIIATLRARTSIIAAANPQYGRYDEKKGPTDNIDLSSTILSRFDLIFIVRDTPNEEDDNKLAEFILKRHAQQMGDDAKSDAKTEELIPFNLLKKYIAYARDLKPKLTAEAMEEIKKFYVKLRSENKEKENKGGDVAVPLVARSLEGFVRISEAYAKMGLEPYVTAEHAVEALKLARKSIEDTSKDPVTGEINADRIFSNVSPSKKRVIKLLELLKKKINENDGKPINKEEFLDDAVFELKIEKNKIEDLLKNMEDDGGAIYFPNPGLIGIIKKSKDKEAKK